MGWNSIRGCPLRRTLQSSLPKIKMPVAPRSAGGVGNRRLRILPTDNYQLSTKATTRLAPYCGRLTAWWHCYVTAAGFVSFAYLASSYLAFKTIMRTTFNILMGSAVFIIFMGSAGSWAQINQLSTGNERELVLAQSMDSKSRCANQLTTFISELDELLPATHSSQPITEAIQRSFPLTGCDVDEALTLSRRSKYFDHFERHEKDVVVLFTRRNSYGSGIRISFGLTIPAGDSRLPAAMVLKPGEK
jgi:hypothetical protein